MKISLRQPIRALSSFIEGKLIGLPACDPNLHYMSTSSWAFYAVKAGIASPSLLPKELKP